MCASSLLFQPVIRTFTGQPRYSTPVSFCRQFSTCSLHFKEHVGEHAEGVTGCLASLGSDGTAGGSPSGAKPGDFALQPISPLISKAYDFYSFSALPALGKLIAKDADSYRYLAESIRMHPDQEALKALMQHSGFDQVDVVNLTLGVVALHIGYKF